MGRAFQYAGTRNVLISLWSVEEISTNTMIEKYFEYLKQGKSNMEALREARAYIRKEGYEHPFFWGPFIMVGE
jgi:CHAT domain-containing protein